MDAHNLAVVFGPTLFRIPSEQDMIAYQSQVNGMIELLIKCCDEIFPSSGETLSSQLSETEDSESGGEEGKQLIRKPPRNPVVSPESRLARTYVDSPDLSI